MRLLLAALAAIALLTTANAQAQMKTATAYDFSFEAIDGKPLAFENFRGKVVLVVNAASYCGFTKQYTGLEDLYRKYKDRGLVVLGVPSNDFGSQEPGTNAEIAEFCQGAFNVTFPLTEKYPVKGPSAHPFYTWAAATLGEAAAPRWNFHKYLVGADGHLITHFATNVEPASPRVIEAVEAALRAAKTGG